ncbi:hypothetical protein PUN28_017012 [Cardiocondyla obscurior]|uniref:RING-type domain-containing protein n=1 Tax=Cardiocondyla obscurior TaxID=286306 RepID=A0AAW2EL32_9HYME
MMNPSQNYIDPLTMIKDFQKMLSCTICEKIMKEPTKIRCGHSFCKTCIEKILQKKSAHCPICKDSLNRSKIFKADYFQDFIDKFNAIVAIIEIDSRLLSEYPTTFIATIN